MRSGQSYGRDGSDNRFYYAEPTPGAQNGKGYEGITQLPAFSVTPGIYDNAVTVAITAVICITLVLTVFCAKFVGCILPLVSYRLGFDPAVMSSPFITTIVDAISLLIYFQMASMLLHI